MSETLGPYELQKRIGAGGMADVFLAKGPNGTCVVKRPHAHLCANPDFVRMFLDEAAILAQLHHPNIAQIFDLGAVKGVYYLAMEYVPGFDLMTISLEHERQGELMAAELCARIVADAAGALHFAHEARDRNGQPLNIIHRDVSPHNILLSTQGLVKLIDFGVARANSATHRTQAGLVKGKYPYMSPEQIVGGEIDRRVDVYALGLVLYELLTNVRAIAGATEVEQIDNARSARIRPIEQLRPNLTMPLRQIVAGCLHPDVNGRYPTALAVKEDLEKYLSYERHVVGQEDLLRLFRVVAAESGHLSPTDPELPSKLTEREQVAPLVLSGPESLTDDQALGFSPTQPSLKQTMPPYVGSKSPPPLVPPKGAIGPIALTQQIPTRPSRAKWLLPVAALVLAGVALVLLRQTSHSEGGHDGETPVADVVDAGTQAPLVVAPQGAEDAGGEVVVRAPDAVDSGTLLAEQDPPPARPVDEATVHKASVLFVDIDPPCEISVDGQSYGRLPELELMPGRHVISMVNASLGFSRRITVDLKPGDRKPLVMRASKGKLHVDIVPFGELRIDGVMVASTTSFKESELWEGTHVVEAVLRQEGQPPKKKTLKVDVKGGQETKVSLSFME